MFSSEDFEAYFNGKLKRKNWYRIPVRKWEKGQSISQKEATVTNAEVEMTTCSIQF